MASLHRVTSCHKILPTLLMAFLLSASYANAQQQPTPDEVKAAADKNAAADKAAAESAAMAAINILPECSLAKTNKSCRITIERTRPLTPPTLQMYSGANLTVIVKDPIFFERYFLDYQSGQASLSPDVASSIVQGLLAPLAKAGEFFDYDNIEVEQRGKDLCLVDELTATTITVGKVFDVVKPARECVTQLARRASSIYKKLEPFILPDSSAAPGFTGKAPATTKQDLDRIKDRISLFYTSEFTLSSRISGISNDSGIKGSPDKGDRVALVELADLQKLADAIANDLLGYSVRITGLNDKFYKPDFHDCAAMGAGEAAEQCLSIKSPPDNDSAYKDMVTRTVTYSLNTLNLISNSQAAALDPTKKKLLVSLALNFADSPTKFPHSTLRWEASAGAFFSTLPIRSFSVIPVFTGNMITDKIIGQKRAASDGGSVRGR